MPTVSEMNELTNECTWTWITENSIQGYRITGTNGNSIFLPATGSKGNGNGFWYWSSEGSGSSANCLNGQGVWFATFTWTGCSIRPVTD